LYQFSKVIIDKIIYQPGQGFSEVCRDHFFFIQCLELLKKKLIVAVLILHATKVAVLSW
jgi:hypothetical protein